MNTGASWDYPINSNIPKYVGNRRNSSTPQVNESFSAVKNGYTVYMKDKDTLYSGGNGTGLSYTLKYAEDSTAENPIILAKGVDENGEEFEQRIFANDVSPSDATVVEMRALQASRGLDTSLSLTSLPPGSGEMGLYEKADFLEMFDKAIQDMRKLGRFDLALLFEKSMKNINFL